MPKTLILCSDGTGNAFGDHATNISKLIPSIDLRSNPPSGQPQQIAFYDQGVGTDRALHGWH